MSEIIEKYQPEFSQAVSSLKDELATLRVGRANPLMVENILAEAYGAKTPLKQLASISVPEARTILIQPWDKSMGKEIEKAITLANIGISPVNEGSQIRLTIPPLTEESRKELTKSVGEKMEKTRIIIRQIRDKAREEIVKKERQKEITEDDKYDLQKKLDEVVREFNEQIKQTGEKKEKEIMTI
ncbi:MAG: ribosome recycling factor [Candidatus Buchananbacteria bacterium RIFCSPHIGHO2_01_FULL_39_14]|uniref:Ribosome-recycling factor n=2 Tax=Candidatus Buchananiibacteriota TaxID=1817903 RepID=A0A1G1YSH4_9BACT|nr:MAG: ribosome recycling factor [Candidatus Buchananbacteria bacterium RIFCSPHIGHO2_01_FULL_39_14]OGY48857.1 MAG: ribosome recycling factor [Candidatus Buchananbacteria bacterium RIFCSPHIGHO2_02_FULL_39_17]OGY54377.1 MAG: ribosome recycling factor [Candidatus Buchananbacteria bacterium RIFCSPLOWO2_01_FULL_40_23b]